MHGKIAESGRRNCALKNGDTQNPEKKKREASSNGRLISNCAANRIQRIIISFLAP